MLFLKEFDKTLYFEFLLLFGIKLLNEPLRLSPLKLKISVIGANATYKAGPFLKALFAHSVVPIYYRKISSSKLYISLSLMFCLLAISCILIFN